MTNFRMFLLKICLSVFLLPLSTACYLNPYFRDFVFPDKEKDSLVSLLLVLVAGAQAPPVIQGETIFFPSTGLTWMRCSRGQTYDVVTDTCTGFLVSPQYCSTLDNQCNGTPGGTLVSGPAFNSCSTFNVSGKAMTWRVPTHTELKGIVYCSNGTDLTNSQDNKTCTTTGVSFETPTIRKDWFPGNPTGSLIEFWTSTSDPSNSTAAWKINFATGSTNTNSAKNVSGYLRCVSSR
ncbi:PF07603 family protein [Leptospira santarosai]|uniref:PF07603 family protein n=1 Tax=Leptospira santarosai TaxID=28183 RepID=A0A2P1QVP5_9LEPT|nr:PF07603 family protein [Leptospira santarosai]